MTRNLELAPVCPICLHRKKTGESRRRLIKKGLKELSGRHQQILRYRLTGKTLKETGRKFGITRGRVHQIEGLAAQRGSA